MTTTKTPTPTQVAYKLVYSLDNVLFRRPISKKLDMRYNFSKEVLAIIKQIQINDEQRRDVLLKRKQRSANRRNESINVLQNPLVIDYKKHKSDIYTVNNERICFRNGRNHWAKNDFDKKILSILSRN